MTRPSRLVLRGLAALLLSASVPVAAAPAEAAPAPRSDTSGCSAALVQYRTVGTDGRPVGGWTSAGGFRALADAPHTVQVRLAPWARVGDGCTYPISLAAYTTQGPDWAHSGVQTYLASSTVYLGAADVPRGGGPQHWQTLSVPKPNCFGQIDLYGDAVKYDGGSGPGHGPLPYQPGGVVTPYHLIAAWNGGATACGSSATPSPTPTTARPTPSQPATSTTPVPTPTPSAPASASAPAPAPSTNPTVPPMSSPPATTPATRTTPSPTRPALAETGSSAPVGLITLGAVLALVLGAAALFATRARRTGRH